MAKEANKINKEKKDKKEKKENKSFLKEFKAELKRVSWPTFKQLVNNTTAVLTIVLITAAIVFVLDVIFENLNNYGVEKLKAIVSSNSQESTEELNNDVNSDEIEPIEDESQSDSEINLDSQDNSTDENIQE